MQNIFALFQEDPNEQEAQIRQEQIEIAQQARETELRIKGVHTKLAKDQTRIALQNAAAKRDELKRKANERTTLQREFAAKVGARSVTAEGGRSGRKARQQRLGPLEIIRKAQLAERKVPAIASEAANNAVLAYHAQQNKANNIQGLGVGAVPGHTYKVKTAAEKWTMAGMDALSIASSAGAFGAFQAVPGVEKAMIGKNAGAWDFLFRRGQLKGGLAG